MAATKLLLLATLALQEAPPAAPAARPNFLFVAIDDLKPVVGWLSEEPDSFLRVLYPDAAARAAARTWLTPNLDRLALRSLSFPRATCPAPLCNPSRISVLTGIPAHRHAIHGNATCFRDSPDARVAGAITLPQLLRACGYRASGVGKILHGWRTERGREGGEPGRDWPDAARSWDTWIHDHGPASEGKKTASPFSSSSEEHGYLAFGSLDAPVTGTVEWQDADLVARALEQGHVDVTDTWAGGAKTIDLGQEPFFLACGLFRPHPPWFPPQELLAQVDPDAMAITRAFADATLADLGDLGRGGLHYTDRQRGLDEPGSGRFQELLDQGKTIDPVDGDLRAWREAIRHYLACVMVSDRAVGRLLDALDRSKFRESTVVVLWSDHGWHLGTKWHLGKSTLWEESANCVLLVADPRAKGVAGKRCEAPVNLIDLYRTVSALAGATVPAGVAGHDLSPLLAAPDAPWPWPSLTTDAPGRHSLTDGRFRFIRYGPAPGDVELYDHRADPFERTNLAGRDSAKADEARLEAALQAALAEGG
jgi:arylsulfatase A-like enzyme